MSMQAPPCRPQRAWARPARSALRSLGVPALRRACARDVRAPDQPRDHGAPDGRGRHRRGGHDAWSSSRAASICRWARRSRSTTVVIARDAQRGRRPAHRRARGHRGRARWPGSSMRRRSIGFCAITPFVVTLGAMTILRGAAKGLANEQKIDADARGLDALLGVLPADRSCMLFPPGVCRAWARGASRSGTAPATRRFGRHVFAVGSNERTARLCGIRVPRVKIAGLCARRRARGARRRHGVLDAHRRRSDRLGGARARGHRRGRHRRGVAVGRRRLDPRLGGRRAAHDRHQDRMHARRAAQLGAGARDRRHHRGGGGASTGCDTASAAPRWPSATARTPCRSRYRLPRLDHYPGPHP